MITEFLGNTSIPDLGINNRNKLKDEIKLAKNITDLMLNLPEEANQKMIQNPEIVEHSNMAALLNGSPQTFKLFEKFLENPENKNIMNRNKSLECGTYLLMKNNKDTFKPEELGNQVDLTVSTLHSVIKSIQPQTEISTSQIYTQKANDNNQKIIMQNLDDFGRVADQILQPQQIDDLFKKYVHALKDYKKENQESLQKLLQISRTISCLLASCPGSIDLSKYGEPLLDGFKVLFNNLRNEKVPNKKLMKFTENNMNSIGFILDGTGASFKDQALWNLLIERYFVISPGLIRANPQTIFSNLELARPYDDQKGEYQVKFSERSGGLVVKGNIDQNGLLMDKNAEKSKDIILNFYYGISKNPIPEETALNNLQYMCKSSKFCQEFLQTKHFKEFFDRLKDTKLLPDDKFFKKNCEILKNVGISIAQELQHKNSEPLKQFQQMSSEDVMYPFIEIIEENNRKLTPEALEVLLVIYDICQSRQIYYDRKFPLALKPLIDSQKDESKISLVLLCKILQDSSLENLFEQMKLFENAKKICKNEVYTSNSNISNPVQFSEFKKLSNLPENQKKQNLALQTYIIGELSRTQQNQKDLANPDNNLMDVFDLYDQFEKYGNLPIVAVKTLEAVKNGVYNLSEETLQKSEQKINKIIKQIPPQIEKYEGFKRTQNLLKDILDFFKIYLENKKPKNELERFLEHLTSNQNESSKERLKDTQQIANLYKDLNEELQKQPLNNDQIRVQEILNNEVNELLDEQNTTTHFPLYNLKVAENLRLIANNPNSSNEQKFDSLSLLNKFANNPEVLSKMLNEPFYVDKSSELIHTICQKQKDINDLPQDEQQVLKEDLTFMKQLTSKKEGVDHVLKQGDVDSNDLIKNCFGILLNSQAQPNIKMEALQILKNILDFSNDQKLEDKIINNLPKLLQQCQSDYDLISNLMDMTNILAQKNEKNKDKLVEKDVLKPTSGFLQKFMNKGHTLNTAVAKLINSLCNDKPKNLDYVMKSGVIEILSQPFKDTKSDKDFHQIMAKNMLQLSFQNPDRKSKLVEYGYIRGLVPLFIHYSSPEHFDEKMISLVLKCMANFSLVSKGIETLLNDGVIPAFQNFFDKYKEEMNDQNLLLLCTISNLSYEKNDKFLTQILKDGGLDLVLQALDFYNKKGNEANCEAAIDSLTHLASTQKTVDLLKEKKLHSIDILVDIIRQQLSSPLVYKSLRCLTRFCEYKSLSDRFMNKNGPSSALDLIKPYKKDLKNVYQTLKLMTVLIHQNPDKLEEFLMAGIPEKIIQEFDNEWPVEVLKKIIELFARMVKNEEVKNQIAENFLNELQRIMNDFFKNKQIIRNGVVLMALCSDNVQTVANVQKENGNELICQILKKYLSSEDIVYNDLILMENMIRMHKETKQEYLDKKIDNVVENIVDTCNPERQKKLLHQSKRVLELLRGKQHESITESLDVETIKEIENREDQVIPEEDEQRKQNYEAIKNTNFADLIPPQISKFLKNGRIMRVYGEDSVCRSMHFFMSKDMLDVKCKHPQENFIKQKWIIPIHQIKEIKYKYDKKSPIAKSANFFRKAPAGERCFAVYGPIVYGGQRNFHVVCENSIEARQWYDYLTYVLDEYKQTRKRNLTMNNN